MRIIHFTIIVFLFSLATGCLKNQDTQPCTPKTVESELPAMTKYATDSSITTTSDASGILYQVIDQGTGATPTLQSTVRVNYTGRLLNGTKFDENFTGANNQFALSGVIKAWQLMLPKIKAGGKIKFITPSIQAYSCNPYVPSYVNNQPLYFYVELISVQ